MAYDELVSNLDEVGRAAMKAASVYLKGAGDMGSDVSARAFSRSVDGRWLLSDAKVEAVLESARITARRPSFMVGADYWYMPTFETKHAYGTMVSINLPWLNPVHREEVRESEYLLAADRIALESTLNMARYRLEDALARHAAARESFTIIDRDLLNQARQSFESAEASFRAGKESAIGLLDSRHKT